VHYFQGGAELAERYLSLGCSISVGKPVLRLANRALLELVRRIPLERLLLETDTYPLPGRSTEPGDVRSVAEKVAELRGVTVATIADATTANFRRLIGLAPP
jgi:TatD DNase family protein